MVKYLNEVMRLVGQGGVNNGVGAGKAARQAI